MLKINRETLSLFLFIIILLCCGGCAFNVPLSGYSENDIKQTFPHMQKLPIKVAIYFDKDLKNYIYKQSKTGIIFQMNVGQYVVPISLQMASEMFEKVIVIDSLDSLNENRNDIEAIVVPELLYCYGNAIGTLSGHIECKTIFRVSAYDLSWNMVWRDEAIGESRSKNLDFIGTFLSGMKEVGETGYKAGFQAATKIIDDFRRTPPKELYSLLEIKNIDTKYKNNEFYSNTAVSNYHQKGIFQYERKNYLQALYSFDKAETIDPRNPVTLFYSGVCNTYIGQKEKANNQFVKVINYSPESIEAADCKNWENLLRQPIKIAILNEKNPDSDAIISDEKAIIENRINNTMMYQIIDTQLRQPALKYHDAVALNKFLGDCYRDGIRIVLINDFRKTIRRAITYEQPGCDIANDYILDITSTIYSTKRKAMLGSVHITRQRSNMYPKDQNGVKEIFNQLAMISSGTILTKLNENCY